MALFPFWIVAQMAGGPAQERTQGKPSASPNCPLLPCQRHGAQPAHGLQSAPSSLVVVTSNPRCGAEPGSV